jgi:hypothetical protein
MGDYEDRVLGRLVAGLQNDTGEMGPVDQRITDLQTWLDGWWLVQLPETLRKANKYGSADLELIGQAMLLLLPEEKRDPELGLVLGISFYLAGKVARIFGEIERGEKPDADSFYDAAIYAIMALKTIETGKWL